MKLITKDQIALAVQLFNDNKLGQLEEYINELLAEYDGSSDILNIRGALYQKKEQFLLAREDYEQALRLEPNNVEVLNNLGLLLSQLNLKGSEQNFTKAIEINQNFLDPYLNLIRQFLTQQQFTKAKTYIDIALERFPENLQIRLVMADFFSETREYTKAKKIYTVLLLGGHKTYLVYLKLGMLEYKTNNLLASIKFLNKALEFKPNDMAVLKAKCKILTIAGRYAEAANTMSTIFETNSNKWDVADLLNIFFSRQQAYAEIFVKQINEVLEDDTLFISGGLVKAACQIVRNSESFKICQNVLLTKNTEHMRSLDAIVANEVLLNLMRRAPVVDLEIENVLIFLRGVILSYVCNKQFLTDEYYIFLTRLAMQCYLNEYIYEVSEEQENKLNRLIERVKRLKSFPNSTDKHLLAVILSFTDPSVLPAGLQFKESDELTVFINDTLENLSLEATYLDEIITQNAITNSTSIRVQTQYEANPYPRWTHINHATMAVPFYNYLTNEGLGVDKESLNIDRAEVLIAGCGTGQHAISTRMKILDANITAIDLSKKSLAYAIAMSDKHGIRGITFQHCDLLDCKYLKKKYSLIECVGVLHHMNDPEEGLKALVEQLLPGGIMRIGLYSKIAREAVIALRKQIEMKHSQSKAVDLREIRSQIKNNGYPEAYELTQWGDFYTSSEFRDLALHEKEHQFTLPQISKLLLKFDLKFMGFHSRSLRAAFSDQFGDISTECDLDIWHDFEKQNPRAFIGMYDFYCQKTSI